MTLAAMIYISQNGMDTVRYESSKQQRRNNYTRMDVCACISLENIMKNKKVTDFGVDVWVKENTFHLLLRMKLKK